jgi:hypothetical protein
MPPKHFTLQLPPQNNYNTDHGNIKKQKHPHFIESVFVGQSNWIGFHGLRNYNYYSMLKNVVKVARA